jgi:hypothetical protein
VADALHPQFKTANGHIIDWFVISQHLFLNHGMLRDLESMCASNVTIGRMNEEAFETQHHFTNGALDHHTAPPRHGWNRAKHALVRLTRQKEAQLSDKKEISLRHSQKLKQWEDQIPLRAGILADGLQGIEWLRRCGAGEGVVLELDDARRYRAQRRGSRCESAPLLVAGSRKAPILVLEGQAGVEAGEDETTGGRGAAAEAPAGGGGGDRGEGTAEDEQDTGAQQDEQEADAQQDEANARALNDEEAEYTMTAGAAMEAMRQEAAAGAETRRVRNPGGQTKATDAQIESILATIEGTFSDAEGGAPLALEGLKSRVLTNTQRGLLVVSLKPVGWKGLSKFRTADALARELLVCVNATDDGGQGGMAIGEWVEKARALIRG